MLRRSREEWSAVCEACDESGLTVAEFARLHDLNAKTLYWWRSQLNRRRARPGGVAAKPVFVEVSRSDESDAHGGFSARVRVGSSVVLELCELPPTEWVAELARQC